MYFGSQAVNVYYGKKQVLKDVALEIEKGKTTAIIGLNGSGKSTILKVLGRLIKFDGTVIFKDQPLKRLSHLEIARTLSLLPQSAQAPSDITVRELVSLGRFPYQRFFQQKLSQEDEAFVDQVLHETQLWEFRQTKVAVLSGGQQQRAFIAMVLAQDSEIILLDEPTTYLDLVHQLEILSLLQNLVKKHHKTIVYVIHELNHAARFADNLILLKSGQVLAQGSVEQLFTPMLLKDCFGLDVSLGYDSFTKRLMITGVKND